MYKPSRIIKINYVRPEHRDHPLTAGSQLYDRNKVLKSLFWYLDEENLALIDATNLQADILPSLKMVLESIYLPGGETINDGKSTEKFFGVSDSSTNIIEGVFRDALKRHYVTKGSFITKSKHCGDILLYPNDMTLEVVQALILSVIEDSKGFSFTNNQDYYFSFTISGRSEIIAFKWLDEYK